MTAAPAGRVYDILRCALVEAQEMLSDQHASPELHEAFSWLERDVIDALKMYGERIMPWKTNAPAAIGAEEYGR